MHYIITDFNSTPLTLTNMVGLYNRSCIGYLDCFRNRIKYLLCLKSLTTPKGNSMYKAIALFALLFLFTACTPRLQQVAMNSGTKAVVQCLEQVVIFGLNKDGLITCLQVSSITITNSILAEVNHVLIGWTDSNIQILADNIGVESQEHLNRNFNRWLALNGIIQNLSRTNPTPVFYPKY